MFFLAGLLYIVFAAMNAPERGIWSLIIAGPAILVGLLYLANWQLKQAKS